MGNEAGQTSAPKTSAKILEVLLSRTEVASAMIQREPESNGVEGVEYLSRSLPPSLDLVCGMPALN